MLVVPSGEGITIARARVRSPAHVPRDFPLQVLPHVRTEGGQDRGTLGIADARAHAWAAFGLHHPAFKGEAPLARAHVCVFRTAERESVPYTESRFHTAALQLSRMMSKYVTVV